MRNIKNNSLGVNKKFVRSTIIGTVLSAVTIILMILIGSLLFLLSGKYPLEYLNYIMLGILGIGGFIGGYISARLNKSSGLLIGLITGLVIYLVILISGLGTSFDTITMLTLFKLIVLTLAGAFGGILGVNKKEKLHIK